MNIETGERRTSWCVRLRGLAPGVAVNQGEPAASWVSAGDERDAMSRAGAIIKRTLRSSLSMTSAVAHRP